MTFVRISFFLFTRETLNPAPEYEVCPYAQGLFTIIGNTPCEGFEISCLLSVTWVAVTPVTWSLPLSLSTLWPVPLCPASYLEDFIVFIKRSLAKMMVNIFQCANCDSFLCVSHLNLERDLFFQLTVIQELEISHSTSTLHSTKDWFYEFFWLGKILNILKWSLYF